MKDKKARIRRLPKQDFVSVEEYLEKELLSETKNEYHNGVVVPKYPLYPRHTITSINQSRILVNLIVELNKNLDKDKYEVLTNAVPVYLEKEKKCIFSDLVVVDKNAAFFLDEYEAVQAVKNPKFIIDISPKEVFNTKSNGITFTLPNYFNLESLEKYFVVNSENRSVSIYRKNKDEGILLSFVNENESFKIGENDIEVNKIYENVDFELNIEVEEYTEGE